MFDAFVGARVFCERESFYILRICMHESWEQMCLRSLSHIHMEDHRTHYSINQIQNAINTISMLQDDDRVQYRARTTF